MIKRILCFIMVAMAASFAQDTSSTFIRNICDTLQGNIEFKLAYVDEILWSGDKNLSKADSIKERRHQGYSTLEPIYVKHGYSIPYSITAGCIESNYNLYAYAEWNQNGKNWTLNNQNDDYATQILDINIQRVEGFDSSNAYNILAFQKSDVLDLDHMSSENMMVSRTFELNFDYWYAIAKYKTELKLNDTAVSIRSYAAFVTRLDSLDVFKDAVKALKVPDSISKVQVQIFHAVLNSPNLKVPESSSSTPESSSSIASSSSAIPSSSESSDVVSSSSEALSSMAELSSSSENTTAIGRLQKAPKAPNFARQVRRLDGSIVNEYEILVPGVYYVKSSDGRWQKQMVMPK